MASQISSFQRPCPRVNSLIRCHSISYFSLHAFWVLHVWPSQTVMSNEAMRLPDHDWRKERNSAILPRFWALRSLRSRISQVFFITAGWLIIKTVNEGGQQSVCVSAVSYIIVMICTMRRLQGKTDTESRDTIHQGSTAGMLRFWGKRLFQQTQQIL